jgi:large subunit ribosomal protein L6
MSRIGNKSIAIPKGVTVNVKDDVLFVKGPKNSELSRPVVDMTSVVVENDQAIVRRANDSKPARARHGLMRALLNNMIIGVSKGFVKVMELHGVGYKVEVKGKTLVLALGYSHPIEYPITKDIKIDIVKGKKVPTFSISGMDKERVGQVAAEIRSFRIPDSYKGKGVRYQGEIIRTKTGKSK